MVVMNSYAVTIEFAPSYGRRHRPTAGGSGYSVEVLLIESHQDPSPQFTLYDGENPLYVMTEVEMDELLRLLGQMTVRAPWDAETGRDGTTYTLRLEGSMSHAEYNWWGKVPKGWESIGAVCDYVMSLAKRHGYAPALCG